MTTTSLAEAFPVEQARVRLLLTEYRALGAAGALGAALIEQTLQRADRAVASQDVTAMIVAFEDLKGCK